MASARTPGPLNAGASAHGRHSSRHHPRHHPPGPVSHRTHARRTHVTAQHVGPAREVLLIAADHFVKEHEYVPTLITGGVPAVKDLATKVRLLLKELGFKGTARIATYGEREYIILSGYAGLRKILTGTRYELKNAKIVEMGLGKLNAARSVAEVSRLSVFLVLGVDVVQYYLLDKQTPAEVGWDISTDLLKGVGASFVGAAAAVGAGALTSVAVVPLATGVVVTFVAGVALDHFFPTSTIAHAMSKHFSDAVESSEHYIEHLEHQFLP